MFHEVLDLWDIKRCEVNKRFPGQKVWEILIVKIQYISLLQKCQEMFLMHRASKTKKPLFLESILRVRSQVGPAEAMLIRTFSP